MNKYIVMRFDYKISWYGGLDGVDFSIYLGEGDYNIDVDIRKGEAEGYINSLRYDNGIWVLVKDDAITKRCRRNVYGGVDDVESVNEKDCIAIGRDNIVERLLS